LEHVPIERLERLAADPDFVREPIVGNGILWQPATSGRSLILEAGRPRPVPLIVVGKAHPRDEEGKAPIQ
jgi:hypothetical protein